jgi:hypothetical protein
MDIIERFIASTKGDNNEDRLSIRRDAKGNITGIGLCDGATSDGNLLYEGRTGGWWTAEVYDRTFSALPENATHADFLDLLQQGFQTLQQQSGVNLPLYASSAELVKRDGGYELWRVGDVMMGYCQSQPWDFLHPVKPTLKQVDRLTAELRRYTLTNLMATGTTDPGELTRAGRAALADALKNQLLTANHPDPKVPYAFGVLCAERSVPERFRQRKFIDAGARVVLASDGFPELDISISSMQRHLNELRENDPHLIGLVKPEHASTKGFYDAQGNVRETYDDTTAVVVQL